MVDPDWIGSGWGIRAENIDSLTRLIGRIGTLQVGERFVWRGASNYRWPILSSLQRDMQSSASRYEQRLSGRSTLIRDAERQILMAAREWNLGFESGAHISDLQLLATLQHHGVPTRLLDVTSDPMTALWFACQNPTNSRGTTGVLFAFNVTRLKHLHSIPPPEDSVQALADPLGWSLESALQFSSREGQPVLIEPTVADARMIAQQGLFLMGQFPMGGTAMVPGLEAFPMTPRLSAPGADKLAQLVSADNRRAGRPGLIDFLAIVIPSQLKRRMLNHLAATYNRRYRSLFPDLPGFSEHLRRSTEKLPEAPTRARGAAFQREIEDDRARDEQAALPVFHLNI